jgi:hypothetical protein
MSSCRRAETTQLRRDLGGAATLVLLSLAAAALAASSLAALLGIVG